MAFIVADRIQETSVSPGGTGSLNLSGTAPAGFKTFNDGIGSGNNTYYCIYDTVTYEWEVGFGSYTAGTPGTLSRTIVLSNSSNTTSFINFTSGNTLNIFVTYPSEKAAVQDYKGNINLPTDSGSLGVGEQALSNVDPSLGFFNTGFGNTAGRLISSGTYNTAIGAKSLFSATTANQNTAVGFASGFSITTGSSNTAIGINALTGVDVGNNNTAVGYFAGGNVYGINGEANTFLGAAAGTNVRSETNNIGIGYSALNSSGAGSNNIAIGTSTLSALSNPATGNHNIAIGNLSGSAMTSGNNNVILGGNDGSFIDGYSNNVLISDGQGHLKLLADAAGFLGVGVRPYNWPPSFQPIELKYGGAITASGSGLTSIWGNAYFEYSTYTNIYKDTNFAAKFDVNQSGTFAWSTAPSGNAGDPITFTQRMTLDNSGNLGIGTSSPSQKLDVVGTSRYTFNVANAYTLQTSVNAASSAFVDDYKNALSHIWQTSGTERMRIDSSGNVLIGTTSAAGTLTVKRSTDGIFAYLDGTTTQIAMGVASSNTYINAQNGNAVLTFQTNGVERSRVTAGGGFSVGTTADPGAGAIYATGNITAYYSDDRLKTKLGGIENALDKVKSLSGFYYEANQTAQDLGYKAVREVGVSAQQVQAVMPEVVKPAPIDQQYLTVDYERLVPLLIEAIKELEEKVAKLEGK